MPLTKAPRTLTLLERKAYRDAYRGKVLLDATDPTWPEGVASCRLRMGVVYGECGCVLAQWAWHLPGYDETDYWDGLEKLGLKSPGIENEPRHAHYGFNAGAYVSKTERGRLTALPHLQRAWTYILRLLGR